jgi:hypothetical protein
LETKQKTCGKCKQEKPATPEHFAKNRSKPDGLQGECRPCRKLMVPPQLLKYKEETAPNATRSREQWTDAEDKIVADRTLTITQAAKALKRTFAAVANRRRVLKKEITDGGSAEANF